jgi:hypothetical protein
MVCALLVVSGLGLFLAGIITGAALLMLLERTPPDPDHETPPICDDP